MRKYIKMIFVLFMSFSLAVTSVDGIYAFDNKDLNSSTDFIGGGAHRLLNKIVLEKFVEKAKSDSILKDYDFYPDKVKLGIKGLTSVDDLTGEWTKNLFKAEGSDIYKCGQTAVDLSSIEKKNIKTFSEWIIDAGYSADEPEKYMSWRHFYNPIQGKGEAYLTDLPSDGNVAANYVQSFTSMMGESNPKTNAKTWALSHLDNKYDWVDGMDSLDKALSMEKADEGYAAAWRSIGQTLHLINDMTVPAHVRNDSHPAKGSRIFDNMRADAYEYIVSSNLGIITENKNREIANKELNSRIDALNKPSELFDVVANHVNTHFFSSDTIPYRNWRSRLVDNNSDGFVFDLPDYNKPKIKDKYSKQYVIQDELGDLIMYHESWLSDNGWDDGVEDTVDKGSTYLGFSKDIINKEAVESQAKRLIPIAIKSSVKMLDLSIPRLSIDGIAFDKEKLTGKVTRYKRQDNGSYTSGETINSVQRMVVFVKLSDGGKQDNFLLPPVTIKDGRFELKMKELERYSDFVSRYIQSDKPINIEIGLDMGGILVKSASTAKPELIVEPKSANAEVGKTIKLKAKIVNGPRAASFKWSFGDGTKEIITNQPEIDYACKNSGKFNGYVAMFDSNNQNVEIARADFELVITTNGLELRKIVRNCCDCNNQYYIIYYVKKRFGSEVKQGEYLEYECKHTGRTSDEYNKGKGKVVLYRKGQYVDGNMDGKWYKYCGGFMMEECIFKMDRLIQIRSRFIDDRRKGGYTVVETVKDGNFNKISESETFSKEYPTK